jgi:hypothetical protein
MNLASAERGYWRSTLVEKRGQASRRASDYINMQCIGRAQRYMLFLWTLETAHRALRRMRRVVVPFASRLATINVI